jgi:hypothetical protein
LIAWPGEAVRLERGGKSFRPFALTDDLATGALEPQEWRAICEESDINDLEWQDKR